jgi:hypothetical protein
VLGFRRERPGRVPDALASSQVRSLLERLERLVLPPGGSQEASRGTRGLRRLAPALLALQERERLAVGGVGL